MGPPLAGGPPPLVAAVGNIDLHENTKAKGKVKA
jgi:hypothetical protein